MITKRSTITKTKTKTIATTFLTVDVDAVDVVGVNAKVIGNGTVAAAVAHADLTQTRREAIYHFRRQIAGVRSPLEVETEYICGLNVHCIDPYCLDSLMN